MIRAVSVLGLISFCWLPCELCVSICRDIQAFLCNDCRSSSIWNMFALMNALAGFVCFLVFHRSGFFQYHVSYVVFLGISCCV
jgi:hypothetical protein